jgi:hypothetical protein
MMTCDQLLLSTVGCGMAFEGVVSDTPCSNSLVRTIHTK